MVTPHQQRNNRVPGNIVAKFDKRNMDQISWPSNIVAELDRRNIGQVSWPRISSHGNPDYIGWSHKDMQNCSLK